MLTSDRSILPTPTILPSTGRFAATLSRAILCVGLVTSVSSMRWSKCEQAVHNQ